MPATQQQAEAVCRLLDLIRRAQDAVIDAVHPGGDPNRLHDDLAFGPYALSCAVRHGLESSLASLVSLQWQVCALADIGKVDLPNAPTVHQRASARRREAHAPALSSKD